MARQADPDYPGPLAIMMAPFVGCFTRPTWANLLVLAAGAILSPGRRTVAAALSSVGLRGAATFTNYHRVLNRSRWSGQAAARCLLELLVAAFVPNGPIVVGGCDNEFWVLPQTPCCRYAIMRRSGRERVGAGSQPGHT